VISKYYALTKVLLAILLQSPIAISCLKNRNTVGESPNNIRKVLRWESDISIGGAAGEQTTNGDIWTWSRSLLFFVLSCCVRARADREMMCERDIIF
jgi:hypothetical protein